MRLRPKLTSGRPLRTVGFQIIIDKSQRVVTTRWSGEISDADLLGLEHRFKAEPAFDRTFARICDLSDVTDVLISGGLMQRWAADPLQDSNVRHAVVCDRPAVLRRVLEFVSASRDHFREVLVFPNYRDAERWITENSHPN